MDYEALKESWSEVEDRDGVRLSWNVFPSSKMVSCVSSVQTGGDRGANQKIGSVTTSRTNWCSLYTVERKARNAPAAVRASYLQATVSLRLEPFLPGRRSRSSLDLPVLFITKFLAASL